MIDKLISLGVNPVQNLEKSQGILTGKTIVATGTLKNFSRIQIAEAIKSHGGKVSSSVIKKTSFVLAGSDPGSKLDKAEKLGVEVINEAQFVKMIKG